MLRRRLRQAAYIHGEPCWVELSTGDRAGAERFYCSLLGWTSTGEPAGASVGEDRVSFSSGGKAVAGAGPLLAEDRPSAWTAYVAVDSCEAAVAETRRWGGEVLCEPHDVGDAGRRAVIADPSGAVLAVWQAGASGGAQLRNKVGSLCWIELATRDVVGASAFYNGVFGWAANTLAFGPDPTAEQTGDEQTGDEQAGDEQAGSYTEWKLGPTSVAGMVSMGPQWPEDVPSHWLVYFAVADCEPVSARVGELGGSVAIDCTDIPPGRFSVVSDPEGAVFSVIRMAVGG